MDLHRPGIFVELGTHTGVSYCAFCQAATELMLPAKCHAVDTWKGDEHAGFYAEAVFEELNGYHAANYSHFSSLMRMTFDEASGYFTDGTIDLLHIDGFHTYDAVRHDFDTWLPKMSPRGVVLLHDSFARERDFGVGLLLEELRAHYPVFEFTHGYGLAVVGVGPLLAQEPLFDLFRADGPETVAIRTLFSSLGARISSENALTERNATVAERDAIIATCNATIAERDVKIARLRKQRQLFTYIIISSVAVFSLISLFMLGHHNWF
ncbi:MAG: class I SAM-dependent methyltransferase [Syntrophobacteraceae bacterium]